MKALVLQQYNHLALTDVPTPTVGERDVLVRIRAAGICGSDVHGMDGSTGRRRPPIVMGHEAAGVIEAVGPGVSRWHVGEGVTFDSTVYCGRCHFCRAGEINLCDDRMVLGVSCEDYRRDGAFAEYLAVPEHIVYGVPDGVTFEQAATVEPVSIAVHAANRTALRLGESVVVVGAGVIGLLALQAARAAGAGLLVAADVKDSRLALAADLGADVALRADQVDVPAEVARLTGGRGADAAIEAVGLGETVAQAVACVRKGGRVTLIGNLAPETPLALQRVVTREITLLGSCASRGEYPACLDLMQRGTIRVDPLISATAPLADGAEWFRRLYDGEEGLMKVILTP